MSRASRGFDPKTNPIKQALRPDGRTRLTLILTSGLVNLLTLTGSLFMMQVYDRVLGSQSVPTLIGLSIIALFAYLLQGILDAMRTRILVLISEGFDAEIGPRVASANLLLALRSPTGSQQAIRNARHVEEIRAFVAGPGPIAALDLPWLPIYLLVVFVLHWSLAFTIVVAAVFLVWLTFMTEKRSREPAMAAQEAAQRRAADADASVRNTEAVHSMGMRQALLERWRTLHETYLGAQRAATFSIGGFAIAARTSRMMLQSIVLGLGAYLAIKGEISAGAIIAASILSARALAPIDQAIAGWKPFVAAREAYKTLTAVLRVAEGQKAPLELKPPHETLTVADVTMTVPTAVAPGSPPPPPGQVAERTVLQGVRFQLKKGDTLAIIGPSASGKSTLGRALVGVWQPRMGAVKLDGAALDQWSLDKLGAHIGYLPQDVQLFDGTIAENISRFQPEANPEQVVAAAQAAGFHEHVLQIGGYDRRVGPSGTHLSAGQRQRLGLARALYGKPFLVVLDEPNSNLDIDGKNALQKAIEGVSAREGIVVIIAHDLAVLDVVDHVLALDRGQQIMFDKRDVVLQKLGISINRPAPGSQPRPARPGSGPTINGTATPINTAPTVVRRDRGDVHAGPTVGQGGQSGKFEGPKFVLQSGPPKHHDAPKPRQPDKLADKPDNSPEDGG